MRHIGHPEVGKQADADGVQHRTDARLNFERNPSDQHNHRDHDAGLPVGRAEGLRDALCEDIPGRNTDLCLDYHGQGQTINEQP